MLFATYLKCRSRKVTWVWTHIHCKLNLLFLQAGPHNSLNSHYRLLTFLKNWEHYIRYITHALQIPHLDTVKGCFLYRIRPSLLPKYILYSIMQCFQGVQLLYYTDLSPLKAITCIPAVLVSQSYHCTNISVQQQLYLPSISVISL